MGPSDADDVAIDPAEVADSKADGFATALPDVQCTGTPTLPAPVSWRHRVSNIIGFGTPNHRGFDLIASASDTTQEIAGAASYGLIDKALVDEQVDIYACRAGAWQPLGSAVTDKDGLFKLTLSGSERLPIGMRDMYIAIPGDNSGAVFLAVVASDGTAAAVSDVDGTLTSSELAYPLSLITGAEVAIHPNAPTAMAKLRTRGYLPVYVTARGHVFTAGSRTWLAQSGMPRGPLRLAPTLFTMPGSATAAYKINVLTQLESHGIEVAVGIGNRASDIDAYSGAGVAASAIWIKGPEYEKEVQPKLEAGLALGFTDYAQLSTAIAALPTR
ncbi:MAG: hypothetical protein KBG15_18080 [Kofleriaceae bacterium]|nr:hypothetical protein [Kofleriaceae bacterium]